MQGHVPVTWDESNEQAQIPVHREKKKPKTVKAAWKGPLWLWACFGEAEGKIFQTVCWVVRAAAFLLFPEAAAGGGVWQSVPGFQMYDFENNSASDMVTG